jgi:hypothetical protein
VLLSELRSAGYRPIRLEDVAQLGDSLVESVKTAIDSADLIIAALPREREHSNSLFEAGVAVGLGKPVVVVAEPGTKVPLGLSTNLIIQSHLSDAEAIKYALEKIPRQRRPSRTQSQPSGRPLGPIADDLIARIAAEAEIGNFTESVAINTLRAAIDASGAIAVQGNLDGFDLGVWADDLESIGANPLIIEYKKRLSLKTVNAIYEQIRRGYQSARLVLLVYGEGAPNQVPIETDIGDFPVLVVSLHDLLSRMRLRSFAEVVRQIRNDAVHGEQD